jgi:catechol 2,3-dioxygenase-like lactoylglutathione lyase family enzyme
MERRYDRSAEDLGNIVALEHVNVTVPDQQLATLFYITGLGLTRDPYLMTGVSNMWINAGRTQFHLPTGGPQVLRGRIGLVVPDLDALLTRLGRIGKRLAGTKFAFRAAEGYVDAVCPWGNRIRAHQPDARFGPITLGIAYVEFDVPSGAARGIARFYREIMGARADVEDGSGGACARVEVGAGQEFIFRESSDPLPGYDGHHVQIYIADFSGPYRRLLERSLITEESDQHQYRFRQIADPDSGAPLFAIEHEVRSMRHPLFLRPLVNRDPSQTNFNYAPGRDAYIWATRSD